ncbi:alpha/beta hydrolase [Dongia sp.]|uniref:alpha/beta hydrolase n=1 Tax=Dongia sp. TaxID=1977262 RepID=UPI0037533E59
MPETNPLQIDPEPTRKGESGIAQLQIEHGCFLAYRRRFAVGDGAKSPGIVFLGGFKSDMSGTKASALDDFCHARGLAFLRFDYSGHGESSGDFLDGTISRWFADALAAFDRLTEGPQILIGSSMGGWIMLLLALARPERIKGLIGLAPAPDFTEDLIWQALSPVEREKLLRDGKLEQPSDYSPEPYVITRALIEDGRRHLLLSDKPGAAIGIDVPVRLLHGLTDPDVPPAVSLRLQQKLTSDDVVVQLIKDGDHRLSRPQDLQRLYAVVEELVALSVASSAVNPAR